MSPEALAALSKVGGFGLAILVTAMFGRYLLQRIAKLEADNDKLTEELSKTYQSIGTLADWLKDNWRRDQERRDEEDALRKSRSGRDDRR